MRDLTLNTSVDDLRSSIDCAEANGTPYSVIYLKGLQKLAEQRGYITMARLLASRIRRYEKRMKAEVKAGHYL